MDSTNTRKYRIGIISLLMSATFINALDRTSLAIAVPYIIKDFQIDAAIMGVALSAFFWTYVIFNLVSGTLADRYGVKKVLGWSCAAWSIFSAITGFAQNVFHIVVARLGIGAGEAAIFPVATKVVAGNFPKEERATAVAVIWTGTRLGMAATPLLMAFLISQWGWRAAFIITGLSSLLWCVFWHYGFKDRSELISDTTEKKEKFKIPVKEILADKACRGLLMVKFFQDYLAWMLFTWVPGYLVLERGYSLAEMGAYTSLAFGIAAVSQPFIGYLSDYLIKRGWSVIRARKTVHVTLQVLSASIMIVGFVHDELLAMCLLITAIVAESNVAAHIWTIIGEAAPSKLVGSVGGLVGAVGSLAGSLSPIVTGIIVKQTGSFQLALLIGGIAVALAVLPMLFMIPNSKEGDMQTGRTEQPGGIIGH